MKRAAAEEAKATVNFLVDLAKAAAAGKGRANLLGAEPGHYLNVVWPRVRRNAVVRKRGRRTSENVCSSLVDAQHSTVSSHTFAPKQLQAVIAHLAGLRRRLPLRQGDLGLTQLVDDALRRVSPAGHSFSVAWAWLLTLNLGGPSGEELSTPDITHLSRAVRHAPSHAPSMAPPLGIGIGTGPPVLPMISQWTDGLALVASPIASRGCRPAREFGPAPSTATGCATSGPAHKRRCCAAAR